MPCAYCRSSICDVCEDRLREDLTSLPALFKELDSRGSSALIPTQRAGGGDKIAVHRVHAPLPVNLLALDLVGVGGVVDTLNDWVLSWYADLGFSSPPWLRRSREVQVVLAAAALKNSLPWARENRLDTAQFARVVRGLRTGLERVSGRSEHGAGTPVGACPQELEEGTRCGAVISAKAWGSIQCDACGARWPQTEFLKLRALMLAEK